jgi:hypothetical protein
LQPVTTIIHTNLFAETNNDVDIYDFYEDNNDNLWIGTSEGIFIRSKDESFQLKKIFYKGMQLTASKFYKDDDGTFYLGTQYSLFVYDALKNAVQLLPNTEKDSVMKKIISSRVVSVLRDTIEQHPVLLVSPYGHYIAYYDLAEKKWISRTDSTKKIVTKFNLRDNLIRKFYKTSQGKIFLATQNMALATGRNFHCPK